MLQLVWIWVIIIKKPFVVDKSVRVNNLNFTDFEKAIHDFKKYK